MKGVIMSEFTELMKQEQVAQAKAAEEAAKQESEIQKSRIKKQEKDKAEKIKRATLDVRFERVKKNASVIAEFLVENEVDVEREIISAENVITRKLPRKKYEQKDTVVAKGWVVEETKRIKRYGTNDLVLLSTESEILACDVYSDKYSTPTIIGWREDIKCKTLSAANFYYEDENSKHKIGNIERGLAALAVRHGIDPALFEEDQPR